MEEIWPFGGGAVGCQQDAAFFVTFVDDIVQVFRPRRLDRFETKVIENQQVRAQVGIDAAFQAAIRASAVDMLEHFLGGDEQHVKTLSRRFLSKRLA